MIDVGICTFRRDSLQETLASLAAQTVKLRVIVADNDETDVRRDAIVASGNALGLDLTYLHAPARNISIARNACLAAATGEWFAFIDDDETAEPDWLARLMAASVDKDIVFGVSRAIYADDAPAWIVHGDFHSNRLAGNDAAWNGYTCNVLMRRDVVGDRRFDLALGQTGGEDTMFFFDAMRAGARFGYAPDAIVTEPTPPARATLRWLVLRRYRAGQIHHLVLKRQGKVVGGTAAATAKAAWCLATAPFTSREQTLRGVLHVGVVAAALGLRPYREYGAA